MQLILGIAIGITISFAATPFVQPIYEKTLRPIYEGLTAIGAAVIAGD